MMMDALKLTSKTIAALMPVALTMALTVTMAGCAVATGTGEETEGQSSAAVAEGKAGSEDTRATKAQGNGETGEAAPSPNNGGTLIILPPTADPVPEPWQAPPSTTSTRAPLKPTLAPQELPQ
jgi:hypothetical protein